MQTEACGLRGGQEHLFRAVPLAGFDQDVNVVGGKMRKLLVIAEDEEFDVRLAPGAKNRRDQLANFSLFRHRTDCAVTLMAVAGQEKPFVRWRK